ncbi:hypothetical protein QFZ33_002681 [Arthrobacter globiformis]|nr:hypothetical protein [Arthrobacter globiformis]
MRGIVAVLPGTPRRTAIRDAHPLHAIAAGCLGGNAKLVAHFAMERMMTTGSIPTPSLPHEAAWPAERGQ